jgi:gamma-glutamylcyclotransferase (GGCT)/AIG2-like uncharacterized protein YtfP
MSQYLFVYGTLQPGCAPVQIASVAAKLRPVGEGFVRGILYDVGGYPGAVPDPSVRSRVFGTVMQLPDDPDVLRELDAYEEIDPQAPETSEYVRELRRVELVAVGTLECWFYRYNWKPDGKRVIASGVWKNRDRGSKRARLLSWIVPTVTRHSPTDRSCGRMCPTMLITNRQRLRGSDKWPKVEAKILSSEIREPLAADFDLGPSSSFDLECENRCTISWTDTSGREHISEYGVPESSPLFELYDGQTVTIRYDPADPDDFYLREAAIAQLANAVRWKIWLIGALATTLMFMWYTYRLFIKQH